MLLLFLSWWLVPILQLCLLIVLQWYTPLGTLNNRPPLVVPARQLPPVQHQLVTMSPPAALEHVAAIMDAAVPNRQRSLQLQQSDAGNTLSLHALGGSALLIAAVGSLMTVPGWQPQQLLLQPRPRAVEVVLLLTQQQLDEVAYHAADVDSSRQLKQAALAQDWVALTNPLVITRQEPMSIDTPVPKLRYLGYMVLDGQEPCGLILVNEQHHVVSPGSMVQDWQVAVIKPEKLTLQYQQQQQDYVVGCTNSDTCNIKQWLP
jgi:hypothetical protein